MSGRSLSSIPRHRVAAGEADAAAGAVVEVVLNNGVGSSGRLFHRVDFAMT